MKHRKTLLQYLLLASVLVATSPSAAPLGTVFTYQGRLDDDGRPVTGNYLMTFWLYASSSPGSPIASNSVPTVDVMNGLFATDVDFGPDRFTGDERWLTITVATNGSSLFTLLQPRTRIAPTPNALYAATAGIAGSVSNNTIQVSSLATVGAPAAGQVLAYNGSALVWQNPAAPGGAWALSGNNAAAGNFLGTLNSEALELRVNNARALRLEPNALSPNFVAGWNGNAVDTGVSGATVAGGGAATQFSVSASNRITDHFGTIGGGAHNLAGNTNGTFTDAYFATVGGGHFNSAKGISSTIGGGANNEASSSDTTVAGGYLNAATGPQCTVGGGNNNVASLNGDTIGGGYGNRAFGSSSTVGGGYANTASGGSAVVAGGSGNRATNSGSTVAGGLNNLAGGNSATVAGGSSNQATNGATTVGGGYLNHADGYGAVVAGGEVNDARGDHSSVGGGEANKAFGDHNSIAGGQRNFADGLTATIGGGFENVAQGESATVAGGWRNEAGGPFDFIGGGKVNSSRTFNGSGWYNTIGGGTGNLVQQGLNCTIGGGYYNFAGTTDLDGGVGAGATVPGGYFNEASGSYSFAAGYGAKARHYGSFVWNGYLNDAASVLDQRFHVYGYNGLSVDYYDQRQNGGGSRWVVVGPQFFGQTISTWTGAYLSNSGIWQNSSDRNRKTDFAGIKAKEILSRLAALPVRTWRYTNDAATVRHLGPTAQDFADAFGLGSDDKSIGSLDESGVALAAIQGLNEIVAEKDARIAALEEKVAGFEKQLTTQQQTLARWETRFTALEQATARAPQPTATLSASGSRGEAAVH